jgi:hypothetical protein
VVIVAGILTAGVLLVLDVQAWRDFRKNDPAPRTSTAALQSTAGPAANERQPPDRQESSRSFARGTGESSNRESRPPIVVRATRGDSWLEARLDTQTGAIRFRGNLAEGETLRLNGLRFWLRIGAGENLDVLLNGKRARNLPAGTATVVVTGRGLETVAIG